MLINNLFRTEETSILVSEISVDKDGNTSNRECRIVKEHFLELFVNERLVMKLVCTPSNLVELVIGRMISEGYIESTDDVDYIYICESGKHVRVFLQESAAEKLKLTQAVEEAATCCTDNKIFLNNSNLRKTELRKAEWNSEWIFGLANEFASGSRIHKATQGTHSCYLGVKGEILFAAEDIGRHNAMDKAIGYAAMQGLQRENCILYTTGRVPTDMVKKVVTSQIPVLVTKAVPTDAAVEMARAYNLTLICKAWPDRYEIFNEAH